MAEKILAANDVETIRALGRQVSRYNEKIRNGMRQILIYEGLLAKFSQNEALKKQLKGRGDAILAECARTDEIWGIGLPMHHPDVQDLSKWPGENRPGFALMIVRERVSSRMVQAPETLCLSS